MRKFGPAPRVAGYEIGTALGLGGASTVWAAVGKDGPVALKVADGASNYLRRRFAREAAALHVLAGATAPRVFAQGHLSNGAPFIAMERLPGTTLATYLEALEVPPPPRDIIAIASALLTNLDAVHASGLRHFDIKPANIFLITPPPNAETRLIDFGLTSAGRVTGGSSAAEVAGTIEYMAPERLSAVTRADHRADLYSFAIVLYELMTLRVPFTRDRGLIERGHVALRPPRPSSFAPVPEGLENLVRACLAKAPGKRPTLAEIASELRQTIGAPASLQSSPGAAPVIPRSSRQPIVILVADIDESDATSDIRRRGGIVVRQKGSRHVCVFTGLTCDEPSGSALSAGEALSQRGFPVALHLAELRARASPDENSIRVYGREIESPETWMPRENFSGLVLTESLATTVDRPLVPTPGLRGFRCLSAKPEFESTPTGPILGRDALTRSADETVAESLATKTPTLFTVVGATGLGKSRLAAELAAICQGHPGIRVARYRARAGVDNQRGLLASIGAAELAFIRDEDAGRDVGELMVAAAKVQPTAIVIDDAHRLSDHLCDAIEYATLNSFGTPLWIAVLASTRLEARRRNWGHRAHRHTRFELSGLDNDSAMQLAAELLKPADYPPAAVLERLARWADGNPFFLVEIVRALKRQGLVRERRGAGGFYVTTADLDKLPAIPAGQWLASRLIEALPTELASLVRQCAMLGRGFSRDELASVQDAAETLGATSAADTDVGLTELERLGIVRREDERWRFVHEAVADALADSLEGSRAELLRSAAMEFWRERAKGDDESAMLRFASHAAAVGRTSEAADTYLAIADNALRLHRTVDADQHYSTALGLADDEERRARAFAGRGESRYRMQRLGEAIEDLDKAIRLAEEQTNDSQRASWLLSQGTALDWADRYVESAERVDTATEIANRLADPRLNARCTVSRGRTKWRQEKIDDAIELLEEGAKLTAAESDYEYQVIALLLLPLALIFADRRDEAEVRFAEVIGLCEKHGDRFHLCAAHGNRMFLWRNSPERAVADLRRANQLAREVGQAGAERVTTHNLAEILYWSGDNSESLALAERAFELQRRLMPVPVADDALLLARIRAARDEWDDVRGRLQWITRKVKSDSLAPSDRLIIRMLNLGSDYAETGEQNHAEWLALIGDARKSLAAEEFLEVLYTRARVAIEGDRETAKETLEEASKRLPGCAVWRNRFDQLEEKR